MSLFFVSYAREDASQVAEIVSGLRKLGHEVWMDTSLVGGQTWWDEIVRKVADCDGFLTIVSHHSLSSVACQRELRWAIDLGKPILPVSVESLSEALPRELAARHIIDYYSSARDQAAFALAGAVGSLPAPAPPLSLPTPPPAPLGYLTGIVEQVRSSASLGHDEQRHILDQLQPALRSADGQEQRGGREILDAFSRREDLYADVRDRITYLAANSEAAPAVKSSGNGQTAASAAPVKPAKKRSKLVKIFAVIGGLFIGLMLLGLCSLDPEVCYYDPYGNYVCQ
ncbi:MAG TPA: toll/interleukin-1 receptor domain-containing protein [Nocardioidaceae bacterium]|nr:toll/interleukin-1 receptor domain-containing protein [Nocardioidaceae bacterium]